MDLSYSTAVPVFSTDSNTKRFKFYFHPLLDGIAFLTKGCPTYQDYG